VFEACDIQKYSEVSFIKHILLNSKITDFYARFLTSRRIPREKLYGIPGGMGPLRISSQLKNLGMSTLCQNSFRNNRWLKESGIILE